MEALVEKTGCIIDENSKRTDKVKSTNSKLKDWNLLSAHIIEKGDDKHKTLGSENLNIQCDSLKKPSCTNSSDLATCEDVFLTNVTLQCQYSGFDKLLHLAKGSAIVSKKM